MILTNIAWKAIISQVSQRLIRSLLKKTVPTPTPSTLLNSFYSRLFTANSRSCFLCFHIIFADDTSITSLFLKLVNLLLTGGKFTLLLLPLMCYDQQKVQQIQFGGRILGSMRQMTQPNVMRKLEISLPYSPHHISIIQWR